MSVAHSNDTNTAPPGDDCELTSGTRKACKNCTCGRAEESTESTSKLTLEMIENPAVNSSCGNVSTRVCTAAVLTPRSVPWVMPSDAVAVPIVACLPSNLARRSSCLTTLSWTTFKQLAVWYCNKYVQIIRVVVYHVAASASGTVLADLIILRISR